MSLFFDGELNPKVEIAVPQVDIPAALAAVSLRRDAHVVAACGKLPSVEMARSLERECRRLDALLVAEIQGNRVKLQSEAVTFVDVAGKGEIPGAAFVDLLKLRVGKGGAPATWAEVVAVAKAEQSATVAAVDAGHGK
jgi:hypothetical protein